MFCVANQKYDGVNNQNLPNPAADDGSLLENLFRDVVFALIPLKEKLF